MKAKIENGQIITYQTIPSTYYKGEVLVMGFDNATKEEHESEGFFEVFVPTFDRLTERLGEIYFDSENRVFTYPVLQLEASIRRPPVERYITLNEALARFTQSEFMGILTAAKSNVLVEYWLFRFQSLRQGVNLNDPETIQGLNDLETAGLIGTGRANEILA